MSIPQERKWNGKIYTTSGIATSKKEAYDRAKRLRKKDYLARVVEVKLWGEKKYLVYAHDAREYYK